MRQVENKSRRSLLVWSALNLLGLLLLWLIQTFAPERWWPVMLLVIAPPLVFLLPALWMGVLALRRRQPKITVLQIPVLVFWFAAFSGFCFPPAFAPRASSSSQTISTMTYNIRSGSLGIQKVVAILAAQNADVIFLQEAAAHGEYSDPVPILQAALKNYHVARHHQLTIFSKFPILEKSYRELPKHQVGILEARLDVHGKPLTALCAHFSNPLNGGPKNWLAEIPLMVAMRNAQADLLIHVASRASTPILVGGDFNTPPRGQLYRRLSSQFSDAFNTGGFGFGETFPAGFPIERIDYLWTKNGARASSCRVLDAGASDHRALWAQVEIP
jgi:vancomycin resistance protein VanJ